MTFTLFNHLTHANSLDKLAISAITVSLFALTGCQKPNQNPNQTSASTPSNTATVTSSTAANDTGKMTVYASTNVWGSIAKAVGGDAVEVISAVNDPSQDPHDFQASAQDKLNVSKAQLVLVNGGGYDDWATSLANSVENKPVVINGVDLSGLQPADMKTDDHADHGHENQHEHDKEHDQHDTQQDEGHAHHHHGEFNEHVFFSLDTAKKVAQAVENQLSAKDPANKAKYAQNAQAFMQKIDSLKTKAQAVGQGKNLTAFATEPVTGYLLADMGIKDITPEGYVEQAETDAGVSVKVLDESKNLLKNKQVSMMIANAQTEDATAKTLMETAKTAGVPIVEANETFPAGVTSYTDFIGKTIDNVANAVK